MVSVGNNYASNLPKAENVTKYITSGVLQGDGGIQDVETPSTLYEKSRDRRDITAALMQGTEKMRKESTKYLPQEPSESNAVYDARLKRSVLFAAYKRTIVTSTGRPFSRPIQFDNFSSQLLDLHDNIDLQGNNIDVFSRNVFLSGLAHGHSFVFVDYPKRPDLKGQTNDTPSLEDIRKMRLRPFWRSVDATDVIGWRSKVIDGKEVATQIRIKETTLKPVGMFNVREVSRVRVLEPGGYKLYEKNENGEWAVEDEGYHLKADGTPMDQIPFVPFYSVLPEAFYQTIPPLIDLAYMNVNHWQSSSDQENILHVARVPILFGTGFYTDDDLEVGSGKWIKGPDGSSLSYVEHSGAAISSGREALEDLENRMRIMGAEILVRDPARVTATQKILDSDEATSELQDMVLRFADFLAQCEAITAEYLGLPEEAVGEIELFHDFGISADAFQEAQNLLQARVAKQISQATYLREIQRRGLLGEDVDIQVELEATKAEGDESRLQAEEEFIKTAGE
jgi:hypothetical protein